MKRLWIVLAAAGALALSGMVWAGAKPVTQKYEVVCLKCVAHNAAMGKDGGHGAGHAACAMSCSTKGTDLGLMDGKGNLYVPVNADFQTARDSIKDKAGQTIELTGTVIKTKGILYLQLADAEEKMDGTKMDGSKKAGNGDKD
jgi:hypothetical protein